MMDQQTPTSNPTSAATTTAISSVSSSTPPIATVTPTPTPTPTPTTTAEVSQPTEPSPAQPPPAPQSQPPQPPSFTTTPTTSALPPPAPNPRPRPIHPVASTTANIPSSAAAAAAARPQLIHRPWQHPHPHSHFSQLSSSISPPIPSPQPRGSVVMGVPASHPTPSPPSFSSSFSQQFAGLSRGPVNVADSVSNASNAQMRMIGPMSSSTSMRPAVMSIHHQPRPGVQASLRPSPSPQPPSPNNQTPTAQNFQGHGFMRSPSTPAGPPVSPVTTTPQRPLSLGPIGSPAPSTSQRPALGGPPAPNASQSMQSPNQPWLSTGSQGKPPLPSPSFRPSMNSPSMQQRSHIPSQHHSVTTTSQQQHMASTQPQPLPSNQPPDHFGQQFPPSRGPQSLPHQQPLSRGQVTAHQKSPPLAAVQPNTVQPVLQNRIASTERDESGNRILSKRSIHELVSQIDPSERLDPEVEDILADIADEFVESITTFGCSLAKHRKSDTLEAKDILLHLERNWNITLPGFGGDEIKTYRKPLTNDIHKERLAAVKKSIVASEVASAKNPVGQASANAKSNMSKTPANTMVSPNLKVT